jgi:hypothetical protein
MPEAAFAITLYCSYFCGYAIVHSAFTTPPVCQNLKLNIVAFMVDI